MAKEVVMEEEAAKPQQSPYMLFLLVLVFFIMGLLGFLICHVLKKKGYRCRTSPEDLDLEFHEALREDPEITDEMSNEDTVEQIVKCIIENEANAEALKQMLGDTEGDVSIVPSSLCPHRESQDSGPPHHHTVHLGSTQAPCIHCTRKKRSLLHRMGRSKDGRGKPHPGEITVFSVGRFRVTHIGKKTSIQGSQDDSNISTEPMSSVKDQDELDGEKPQNGLSTHGDHKHESEDLPKNGPEEVGLTKLEKKKGSAIKSVAKNGLQRLNKKAPVTSVKKKGEKDRRSSAPEQTVAQRERIDITDVNACEQRKEKSPVAGDSQTKQVNTEDSAQGH